MPASTPLPVPPLALLRDVSRSFYLSMRILPPALRSPVSAGYLLARATDTLADTEAIPVAQRQAALARLAATLAGEADAQATCRLLAQDFAPQQHDATERRLILALPACLDALAALEAADHADVQAVLAPITQGQALDLQRFASGTASRPAALATRAELDDYTWRVAGCVGEFWTRLGLRHLPGFARLPADRLLELGRHYGMALQLVNILRDAGGDLASGRCYLPADALAACGLSPADVRAQPDRAAPLLAELRCAARAGLDAGLAYSLAVNSRRVRIASALPALIGIRTLALLEAAGPEALRQRVKVPRSEVRGIVLRAAITGGARGALERHYARLGRPAMGQSPQ